MIDGKLDVTARLVIKGFMDPQVNQIIIASATASALSHRMLASYAVNHGLQVVSYDVSQDLFFPGSHSSGHQRSVWSGRCSTSMAGAFPRVDDQEWF